jgi:hypothetical protein
VVQSATYDGADRLTSIEGKRGTTTLTRFAYAYTKAAPKLGRRA